MVRSAKLVFNDNYFIGRNIACNYIRRKSACISFYFLKFKLHSDFIGNYIYVLRQHWCKIRSLARPYSFHVYIADITKLHCDLLCKGKSIRGPWFVIEDKKG